MKFIDSFFCTGMKHTHNYTTVLHASKGKYDNYLES